MANGDQRGIRMRVFEVSAAADSEPRSSNPAPLSGRYTAEYRHKYRHVRSGAPSHVPWTGGVVGQTVDTSVQWTTGIEGMRSSKGDELTYAAGLPTLISPLPHVLLS